MLVIIHIYRTLLQRGSVIMMVPLLAPRPRTHTRIQWPDHCGGLQRCAPQYPACTFPLGFALRLVTHVAVPNFRKEQLTMASRFGSDMSTEFYFNKLLAGII